MSRYAKPKAVVKLFLSPEGHPNGLENTPKGLWIAEEISERAYLVDWTGKDLHKVETESHNTSGIAVGGGFLWMSGNGRGVMREPRPTDRPGGEILQCDLKTGKTIRRFVPPWPGGLHGATWDSKTQTLWLAAVGDQRAGGSRSQGQLSNRTHRSDAVEPATWTRF